MAQKSKCYTQSSRTLLSIYTESLTNRPSPPRPSKECVESSGGGVAWWKAWGKNAPELMSVAVALLSLPGTSGACERNWSVHDLIQSDLRTLLDPGRLRKLVYIYFNIRALAYADAQEAKKLEAAARIALAALASKDARARSALARSAPREARPP